MTPRLRPPTRPALRLAFALAAALGVLAAGAEARPRREPARPAAAAAPLVTVDVSHLREIGLGQMADVVQSAVAAELGGEELATRLGGRVVVRLTGLSLNASRGSDGGGDDSGSGGGATNTDYLEGEIIVLGPGGEVLSRRPQLSALSASAAGGFAPEGAENRRVIGLCRHFAAWLKRSI